MNQTSPTSEKQVGGRAGIVVLKVCKGTSYLEEYPLQWGLSSAAVIVICTDVNGKHGGDRKVLW